MRTIISTAMLVGVLVAPARGVDCPGDCDGNGQVTVDEIIVAVSIALGEAELGDCLAADSGGDGNVTVDELVMAVDAALNGCGDQTTAFVVATDFETGSFGTVSFDDPPAITPVSQQRILNGDAVGRAFNGLVYVVNRFFGDNIQIIDPAQDFATTRQCLTGERSNPQDIAFVNTDKAYVSLAGGTEVLVVDPSPSVGCDDFILDRIDLADLADADGNPELYLMAVVGTRLYVEVQKLDQNNFFTPADKGSLAVIDTKTDELVDEIVLTGQNPFGQTKGITVRNGALLVSQVGLFGSNDGGIERVDTTSGIPEGFFISEAELGADILDFEMVSDNSGYALLSLSDFTNSVVAFDVQQGAATATLISGESVSDIALNDRGQLFVAQRTLQRPGVRIFDTTDNSEVTTAPLNLELPPFDITFIR